MANNPVTVWYRLNEKGDFDFNHYEDGVVLSQYPTIKHPDQTKNWSSGKWLSKLGIISDHLPARLTIK